MTITLTKTRMIAGVWEGIFAGVSSGAAAWAAVQVSKENPNAVIAFIVCDRGDRYLSTGLYNVDDSDVDDSNANNSLKVK